jgi:hypothetical protein
MRKLLIVVAIAAAFGAGSVSAQEWPPSGAPSGTPEQVAWDMLPCLERTLGHDHVFGNQYPAYGRTVFVTIDGKPVYEIVRHPEHGVGIVMDDNDSRAELGVACFEEASGIDL